MQAHKRPRHDAAVACARRLAGDDAAFDAAWRHGGLMALSRAIAHALEVLPAGAQGTAA